MSYQSPVFSDCKNKVLQQINGTENKLVMSNLKCKTLDDINDILIVRKISEIDPTTTSSNETPEAEECLCLTTACDCEKNLLREEQEAILRKQIQMLQADERGKQALITEIAALKQSQEQKAELLRNRQRARDIENERARKIASLPPPLPKSVKSLLKKHCDEPKASKPDVQMPDELQAIKIKPSESNKENKENVLDPEELEVRQRMQEEQQMKAKKRYNEALRKDRQKEEYFKIMKQIQDAELQNRREMAKNISSDKKGMPCPLSDRFQISKNQADMEEATEKMFKKISSKEHVIEDIEGYQDHYEDKYKKIESNYESKIIDCIPNFVKENYEYLLEDDSKFEGGKHFSEFDNSSNDILNQAYIETSPGIDELDRCEKIDLAISHLDKLRTDIQKEYEQDLKPLLAAMEVPKKLVSDKAVETDFIKLSENKAVETDIQFEADLTSPSPSPSFDFKTSGVMAFKRRQLGPVLRPYQEIFVPEMHQRNVHYSVPSASQSERLTTGSWSSSSYCSLPSKHGIPPFCNETEPVKCDICVAEGKDDFVNGAPPDSVACKVNKKSDKSTISTEKVPLSKYVQQVAKKYLAKPFKLNSIVNENTNDEMDSVLPLQRVASVSPAFEKEVICKSAAGVFFEQEKSKESAPTLVKENFIEVTVPKSLSVSKENLNTVTKQKENISDSSDASIKLGEPHEGKTREEHLEDDIYNEIKSHEFPKSPVEYSDYDLEAKRIQAIQQVLSRRIPRFALDVSPKSTEIKELKEEEKPDNSAVSTQNRFIVKPHVYHDLSTIQELDSALTAGSLCLSCSKLSDISETKAEEERPPQEKSREGLAQSSAGLQMASLLDPPDSEISELAKSIQFVEVQDKAEIPLEVPKSLSSEGLNVMSVSSKDDLSTPTHAISSQLTNSGSSIPSHGKIFSSTLSGNNTKEPFLKDTRILPQYFKDVSDIQQKTSSSEKSSSSVQLSEYIHHSSESNGTFKSMTPHSDISSPKEMAAFTPKYEHTGFATSSGSFKALTPQSNISSPREFVVQSLKYDHTSSGSFKALTPHSNISSPQELILQSPKYHHIGFVTSAGSFKALTPHSHFSSSKELLVQTPKYDHTGFATSSGSFKTLTPHSNISSPQELIVQTPQYDHAKFATSAGSFQALTPHSNISSPKELIFHTPKYEHVGFTASTESFKALTPHYDISSPSELATHTPTHELQPKYEVSISGTENVKTLIPQSNSSSLKQLSSCTPNDKLQISSSKSTITTPSFPSGESELQRQNFSGNSEFPPLTIRFDISTTAISSNTNSQLTEMSKLSQLSCHLGVKACVSNTMLSPKIIGQKQITISSDKNAYPIESKNNLEVTEKKFVEIKDKQRAYPCPSDFFVPKVSNLPDSKMQSDDDLVEGTLTTNYDESKTKSLGSQAPLISVSENKEILEIKDSESVSSCEEILAESMKDKPLVGKSKESSKKQNLYNLEMGRLLKNQYVKVQGISSSNSSSTENLSDICESKVLYQSTPIKRFSELIQEPGIMEEPDLTLVNTMLSCKIDSPVKKYTPLASNSVESSIRKEKDNTITPTQNECRTPNSQNLQSLGSADTPSMISFLHHEMSCLETEDSKVHVTIEDPSKTPNIPDDKTVQKTVVGRPQSQRNEYKKRTKRLWNNLEEVRKKNQMEQRKRLMEANRLKAKEFAKKLTPKKKSK